VGKILVVDDEAEIRELLTMVLRREGFEVVAAQDGTAAFEQLRKEKPSVVLLDLAMPKVGGLEVLSQIKQTDPEIPVIICTGNADLPTAVKAMRLGAYDYLTKPFDADVLVPSVRRAAERQELRARIEELKQQGESASLAERMGSSRIIQRMIQQVAQVAPSSFTVLIQGETGTGKEMVARAIHQQSPRRDGPFVGVDCGAIPDTLVESELFGYEKGAFTGAQQRKDGHFQCAHGGTLFLDEVGNLPLTTQSKLLRVLEERRLSPLGATRAVPIDVRIVAATNTSFEEEVRAGRFRADLFYRLNEFAISLPPLRERAEDIAGLARRFLAEAGMELRNPVRDISDDALALLLRHTWPGNVRELKNVIRKATLLATDVITPEYLPALGPGDASGRLAPCPAPCPDALSGELSLKEAADVAVADAERRAIRQALEATKGNKTRAAKLLRTDYTTLHAKMKRYAIAVRDFLAD